MSEDDEDHFNISKKCWLCVAEIYPHQIKVRDHCHLISRNKGAADERWKLPVKTYRNRSMIQNNTF